LITFLPAILTFAGFSNVSAASTVYRRHTQNKVYKVSRQSSDLVLRSASVLVQDQRTGKCLVQKKEDAILPIASLTKLMTAMVVLDAGMNLEETITILPEDVDNLLHSRSRLPVHSCLTRGDALLLALMASENRAAHALGRTYPGGIGAFVAAMNAKARSLRLAETHFDDPTGISRENTSSARDLARMADAAYRYRLIRKYSTCEEASIRTGHRTRQFRNTNRLLWNPQWQIGLSKTGYTDEAGRCLVMQSKLAGRPVLIVLLDSEGTLTRFGDANRIKKWMEGSQAARKRTRISKKDFPSFPAVCFAQLLT
jgi:serine-type D-Ala-D-Ala endopeptidase (penicillin-binding protein 7)